MAGNTKLIGFTPRGVVLERWGEKTIVDLTPDAVEAIKWATHNLLPKAPPGQSTWLGKQFQARYDPNFGVVVLTLLPKTAELVAVCLANAEVSEPFMSLVKGYAAELRTQVEEHQNYQDRSDEPGVDPNEKPSA